MQQVEALLLPHLADDDPVGPHPQRLLDQPAQRDLAGALEVRLPGLHRHDVRQRRAAARRPPRTVITRSRAGIEPQQAVEQRRLAGLGAAGDEDVEPGGDRGLEEAGRRAAVSVPSADELVERVRAAATNLRMLTARCRRVMSGMTACSRDPSGSMASTNGVAEVEPPARGLQHPLDQVGHLARRSRIVVVSSVRPRRATNTRPGSLIQISSTSGSSSQRCSGPKPATASSTARATRGGSSTGGSAEASARRE